MPVAGPLGLWHAWCMMMVVVQCNVVPARANARWCECHTFRADAERASQSHFCAMHNTQRHLLDCTRSSSASSARSSIAGGRPHATSGSRASIGRHPCQPAGSPWGHGHAPSAPQLARATAAASASAPVAAEAEAARQPQDAPPLPEAAARIVRVAPAPSAESREEGTGGLRRAELPFLLVLPDVDGQPPPSSRTGEWARTTDLHVLQLAASGAQPSFAELLELVQVCGVARGALVPCLPRRHATPRARACPPRPLTGAPVTGPRHSREARGPGGRGPGRRARPGCRGAGSQVRARMCEQPCCVCVRACAPPTCTS